MSRAPQHSKVATGESSLHRHPALGVVTILVAAMCMLAGCSPFGTKTVTSGRLPGAVVAGKDGKLWFTEGPNGSQRIGRITTTGVVTEISIAPSIADMLAVAPDGTLWFARDTGEPGFGSISPQGTVTPFMPLSTGSTRKLAVGPDGNLWFTDAQNNAILRVTPKGVVTSFPLPTPDAEPWKITAGPGNSLWFTEFRGRKIGRITEDGKITEYPISDAIGPDGIGAGPNNTVWFTEIRPAAPGGGAIGRVTLSGTVTLFPIEPADSWSIIGNPDAITLGPDGNLWFTSLNGGLGRSTPDGQIRAVTLPTLSATDGITTGPDGNLWFSAPYENEIVRVMPSGKVNLFTLPADHYTCTLPC